jgi:chorismate dehydratase
MNSAVTPPASAQSPAATARRTLRLGSVSYLNARPLIYGLADQPDLTLSLDVPARLLDGLRDGRYDVALLPVIDYQRMDALRIVPAGGGIGCDGPTLTVRVFSHVPPRDVTSLACDPDSHTSVALARIVFDKLFDRRPEFIPLTAASNRAGEARLLIGDKVVCEEPAGFEHQLDLGGAWKELTGLPFVFAAWAARADVDLGDLPQRLTAAREAGLANLPELIRKYAVPRGWPPGLALQYLSVYLKYEIGPRQLEAIERFHALAADAGLIDSPAKPLRTV